MPSVQSYIFRLVAKLISIRMNPETDIQKLRSFSEKSSRLRRLPKGVNVTSSVMAGVPVEWIVPTSYNAESVILYFHGGAWILGSYQNHRVLAAHVGLVSGCRVMTVDYRLAPEHPFPASLHDCLAVYRQLLKDGLNPNQIILAGDSVGANLALSLLITLRDAGEQNPAAAICLSPLTDMAFTGKSVRTNNDALLSAEFVQSMSRHYIGQHTARHPLISPHYANLTNLPPLLIHSGNHELLLDDARRLAHNARVAGVDVTLHIWPRMWHVWHIFAPYLPEATQAVDDIGLFVRKQLKVEHQSIATDDTQ